MRCGFREDSALRKALQGRVAAQGTFSTIDQRVRAEMTRFESIMDSRGRRSLAFLIWGTIRFCTISRPWSWWKGGRK